jgi:hypothetical protein
MTENKVTFTLELALDGNRELLATVFRMRNYDAVTNGYIETGFNLFSTTSDGYLVFNGTRVEVGVDMTRFDFVFDFEQGVITLYVDGVKIARKATYFYNTAVTDGTPISKVTWRFCDNKTKVNSVDTVVMDYYTMYMDDMSFVYRPE